MATTDYLLYAETDGSCAHCGLRDSRMLTIHHLVQTKPKNEDYDNKMVLCHNCHHAHHAGKGASAEELREIKRRLIIKTLTVPGHNALKLAHRQGEVVALPFLVLHLVELQLLEKTQTISQWSSDEDPTTEAPDIDAGYKLTKRGNKCVEKWELS
jgi:hypothetical protein